MSQDLTPRQQILLWDLVSRGGSALQKEIKPKVEPKDREPLVRAKMISVAKKKNNAMQLTIEEPGWNQIASVAPTLLKSGKGAITDRPILQFVLARVQSYAKAQGTVYFELFGGADENVDTAIVATAPVVPSLLPIETTIRSAFFDLAGRPARDGVRLRALREKLQSVDRTVLDEALLRMRKSGRANLMNLDNPRDIEAEGDAALKAGNQTFHILWIES